MVTPQIIEVIKSKEAKKRFEFFLQNEPIAVIDYPNRFKKKATLTSKNLLWNISRKGWWKHTIDITAEQSPFFKWSLVQNWRGYVTIRTENNRLFRLKRKGFWKTGWVWLNEYDEPMVEMQAHGWPKRRRGTVTITDPTDTILLFLALIGWFIILTVAEDEKAAAVIS